MGTEGIMGLFPEIPAFPAFPEIPENSPKKAKPFNKPHLPNPTTPISCQKGSGLASLGALPNFLSEGVRLGLDKEIAPDGTYLAYFPFGAMIERSRMTPYHKKLLLHISKRCSLIYSTECCINNIPIAITVTCCNYDKNFEVVHFPT